MKLIITALITGLVVYLATTFAINDNQVQNYSDCIIKKMKDAKNDTAANAIKDACKKKFESQSEQMKLNDTQSINQKIDQLFEILNYMKSKMSSSEQNQK